MLLKHITHSLSMQHDLCVFPRFSSVLAPQDRTQDSAWRRNPRKEGTALDEAPSQELTKEGRKMH